MWTMMKANSYGDYITMITDYASKYAYLRLNYGLKVVEDSTWSNVEVTGQNDKILLEKCLK